MPLRQHLVHVCGDEVPEIDYANVQEFLTLQRLFIAEYVALITKTFEKAFYVPQGISSLTWTDRDMICHGCITFSDLGTDGARVVRIMTKGHGVLWCLKIGAWLADMVTTACRSCARALLTWPKYSDVLADIYGRTLKQEMITTMYDSLFVFDSLYASSFVNVQEHNGSILVSYTMRQWKEIMLAFCMITHTRVGGNAWQLNSDIIRQICLSIPIPNANANDVPLPW
tara:strand:- start:2501 stop:3181 length:681 start_codon:yes stop_codon:yes gene_type:complete